MLRISSFVTAAVLLATASAAQEPAPVAPPTLIEQGRYLATAGDCISCHTRPGGAPFAGGRPFHTPFGIVYSTNITPDQGTGIGGWTEAQFVRALHEGIAADGDPLYPVFPYTAFTKMSEADAKAIYAYMRSVDAVAYEPPPNEMPFPFNQRKLMWFWNLLFLDNARYTPDTSQSAEWNRGAYLVEGLGHCGSCHTPRNFMGAEKAAEAMTGATIMDDVREGRVRPWSAVNLTSAPSGLKAWSAGDLKDYLKAGHSERAGIFGPMNEVIVNSLQYLTDEDVQAMAVYLKSLPAKEAPPKAAITPDQIKAGAVVYDAQCEECHMSSGRGGLYNGPPLEGSAVVQASDPASLINVIIYGAQVPPAPSSETSWESMKAFGSVLNDEQVAALTNFLRASWDNKGGAVTAADVAKQR